jgi:hypothetical protein
MDPAPQVTELAALPEQFGEIRRQFFAIVEMVTATAVGPHQRTDYLLDLANQTDALATAAVLQSQKLRAIHDAIERLNQANTPTSPNGDDE